MSVFDYVTKLFTEMSQLDAIKLGDLFALESPGILRKLCGYELDFMANIVAGRLRVTKFKDGTGYVIQNVDRDAECWALVINSDNTYQCFAEGKGVTMGTGEFEKYKGFTAFTANVDGKDTCLAVWPNSCVIKADTQLVYVANKGEDGK